METIIALIISIAVEQGVPPYFAVAVALTENPTLTVDAVSKRNANGSRDLGVMQLNSYYFHWVDWRDAEENIRAGIAHIKQLSNRKGCSTWWAVAIAYNAGYNRLRNPPQASLLYADAVLSKWEELDEESMVVMTGGR